MCRDVYPPNQHHSQPKTHIGFTVIWACCGLCYDRASSRLYRRNACLNWNRVRAALWTISFRASSCWFPKWCAYVLHLTKVHLQYIPPWHVISTTAGRWSTWLLPSALQIPDAFQSHPHMWRKLELSHGTQG